MKPKGFIMYEDINMQDIALYDWLRRLLSADNNDKQHQLNCAAVLAKWILNDYINKFKQVGGCVLPNNFLVVLKQCILLLQEAHIQQKLSDFLSVASIESANDVVSELNKYIATHEIKHN